MFPFLAIGLLAMGGWYLFKDKEEERHVPRPPIPDPSDPDNPSKDKTPPLIRLAIPRAGAPNDGSWKVVNVPAGIAKNEGGDVVDFLSEGPVDVLVSAPEGTFGVRTRGMGELEILKTEQMYDTIARFTGSGQLTIEFSDNGEDWEDWIVNVTMPGEE